jgi:hypothetical protein
VSRNRPQLPICVSDWITTLLLCGARTFISPLQ